MNSFLISSAPLMIQGAVSTLSLWLGALTIGMLLGIISGTLRSNQLRITLISALLDGMTFILRGIPLFVQLLITYFVLPEYIGINLPAERTATITLGLCSAAYVSNIVRGGINSISLAQWEAAQVLGFSTQQTIRFIIMPQVMQRMLPSLTGEADQLLKSTALVQVSVF